MVSDKYDLAESILPWFEVWAAPHRGLTDIAGYEGWLFISWVFADASAFERVSQHLILHARFNVSGDLAVDSGVPFVEGVPDSIIGTVIFTLKP